MRISRMFWFALLACSCSSTGAKISDKAETKGETTKWGPGDDRDEGDEGEYTEYGEEDSNDEYTGDFSPEDECWELYEWCIDSGVSAEACETVLDECLANVGVIAEICEEAFWACIDDGFELADCIDGYEECLWGE